MQLSSSEGVCCMKRVLCLYRVSTKGQVDKKDDIPMQRRECMAFIERMEDWCFYDELMEKGVSGVAGYRLWSKLQKFRLRFKTSFVVRIKHSKPFGPTLIASK